MHVPAALRCCLASLAVVVFASVPAHGAWSPPANVSASANDLSAGDIAFDRRGRALASWEALRWQSGVPRGHYVSDGWRAATRAPGAAAFSAPRDVPSFVAPPVLYATSRAVGLDQRSLGWQRCGQRTTLRARFGTSDGDFGAPRTINTSTGPGGDGAPVVDANGGGLTVAAWAESTRSDCSRSSVRVAIRRAGANTFGAPLTLRGAGRPEKPSVAVGAGGDVLVVWHQRLGEGRTRIEARVRPSGRSWGPVAALGASTVAGPLVTAVAQNGRAYVAWGAQTISESTGLDVHFDVAVQPAGARTFRPAQTLEHDRTSIAYLPRLGPLLALTAKGALVAWTGRDATWRVRVSETDAQARFGTPRTLSPGDVHSALGDLDALPDGTAALTWSSLDDELLVRDVRAAFRPSDGPFGSPELVSDAALRQPAVALDPAARQPTVTWAQRLGPATSVADITAYVRASTRTEGP